MKYTFYRDLKNKKIKCRTAKCKNVIILRPSRYRRQEYCVECVVERAKEQMRKVHKREREDPAYYEKRYAAVRKSNMLLKILVLTHYGKNGKLFCCWPGCDVKDVDCLTLDHVGDDGAKFRRELTSKRKSGGGGGRETFRFVRKKGFPSGFQTLCANHQLKKEILRRLKARRIKTNENS